MATCKVCGVTLTGRLDTFGPVGSEVCLQHFIDPDDIEEDIIDLEEVETNFDDDLFGDEDGEFERDGMLFCGACGMLAAPGCEEYDWCDHKTGRGCAYFESSPFNEERKHEYDD